SERGSLLDHDARRGHDEDDGSWISEEGVRSLDRDRRGADRASGDDSIRCRRNQRIDGHERPWCQRLVANIAPDVGHGDAQLSGLADYDARVARQYARQGALAWKDGIGEGVEQAERGNRNP